MEAKPSLRRVFLVRLATAFESENALYEPVPEYVPRSVNFGTYSAQSNLHFDIVDEFPGPIAWAEAAAALHQRSTGKSPTRKFGFHCSTYSAIVPIDNMWDSFWKFVWTHQMRSLLSQDEEYSGLQATFFNVVAPYVLEARRIKQSVYISVPD
ncbi:hypothetical protein F4801DRAFT_573944 [Xylaria longipes]|nr:hypothetical protein F4801DRAFT_573944 [Xylaria longipes]